MDQKDGQPYQCRLCDKTTQEAISIFGKVKETPIVNLIKSFLPINISDDNLSKEICPSCFSSLESFTVFKDLCLQTFEKHNSVLKNDNGLTECDKETLTEAVGKHDVGTSTELTFSCKCKLTSNGLNGDDSSFQNGFEEEEETEGQENEKCRVRKRKPQSFYHEFDDSISSSLTEYTNTDSQGNHSDFDTGEFENGHKSKKRKVEDFNLVQFQENLKLESEYFYNPLSLLELTLNVINRSFIPDYSASWFSKEVMEPFKCSKCWRKFVNMKLLSMHELEHMEVEVGEKIDNPFPWPDFKEDAIVRNKWLAYFDENGYEEEDIVLEVAEQTQDIQSEVMEKEVESPVYLEGMRPLVNGKPLAEYSKDQRKEFYPTMKIGRVNRKFCSLCRYTFKDNWAIESHYFSQGCYYTCKYCGMRFNKQRQRYQEHIDEHIQNGDQLSTKIYTATGQNNLVPKLPELVKPKPPPVKTEVKLEVKETREPGRIRPPGLRKSISTLNYAAIKEEFEETEGVTATQSKSGNQAYFCRKCYKVFFKLDEFNVHSKNCDYNQFPNQGSQTSATTVKQVQKQNSFVSIATKSPVKESKPERIIKDNGNKQAFVCFVCHTPFPTIYSRNSHMRIHKNEAVSIPASSFKSKLKASEFPNRKQDYTNLTGVKIKQEPLEPEIQIHEPEPFTTLGGGAVSILPISKNPDKKPKISPTLMELVQNNPNISIQKRSLPKPATTSSAPPPPPPPVPVPINNTLQDDKSYKCSSCWEAFGNKSHLYFHKKNQCQGSRFPCPFCKKRFGTESAYSSHIFYSHPE